MKDNFKLLQKSDLDEYQMNNRTFDPAKDAWRVSVIDGVTLNVDNINIPKGTFDQQSAQIQVINIPEIVKQTEIQQVNTQVIVKEYEKIEVPVIVKEIEYKIVEVPVIVPEIKIIEIEKPVIVKQTEFKEFPTVVKVCMIVQAIATIGILLTHIILKG